MKLSQGFNISLCQNIVQFERLLPLQHDTSNAANYKESFEKNRSTYKAYNLGASSNSDQRLLQPSLQLNQQAFFALKEDMLPIFLVLVFPAAILQTPAFNAEAPK